MKGDAEHEHNITLLSDSILYTRPIRIKAIEEAEITTAILQHHENCIVHFLDIENINITKEYLKSAWNAGKYGTTDFYLVSVETIHQVGLLNITEIFDFQRLLIATSPKVWNIKVV